VLYGSCRLVLTDLLPGLRRLLKEGLLIVFYDSEASGQLAAGQDVETTSDFLFSVLVRNAAQRHLI